MITASWRNDLNCYRYSIHDEEFIRLHGKRFRGNCPKSVRSKKAAIHLGAQKRAELLAQHQSLTSDTPVARKRLPDGRVVPLASDLFSLFVNQFYLPHITTVKAASTVKSERWRCAQLVEYFGKYQLSEIDNFLCLSFQSHRKQRENQYGTTDSNIALNRMMEVLQKVLQLAVDYHVLSTNPARGITALRELPRDRVLNHEEERRLQERLNSPRRRMLALAVTFALQAGLRKGEILRLQKRDLDFERGLILIRDGKTGNSSVPMNEAITQSLAKTIDLRQYEFNQLVFLGVDWIKDTFPQVCQEAGISGLHFHDLRATFVTRMLENGYDAFTVAAAARHSNIKTTAIYARTSSQHLRDAVQSLAGNSVPVSSRSCPDNKNADVLPFRKSA